MTGDGFYVDEDFVTNLTSASLCPLDFHIPVFVFHICLVAAEIIGFGFGLVVWCLEEVLVLSIYY